MKIYITLASFFLFSIGSLIGQTIDWSIASSTPVSATSVEVCFNAVPNAGVAGGCFGGGNLNIVVPMGTTSGTITSTTSTWSQSGSFSDAGGTGFDLIQFNAIAGIDTDLTAPFEVFCVVLENVDCTGSDPIRLLENDFVGPSDDLTIIAATSAVQTATASNNACSMGVGSGAQYLANSGCSSVNSICPPVVNNTVMCGDMNEDVLVDFTVTGGSGPYMVMFSTGSTATVNEGGPTTLSTSDHGIDGSAGPSTHSYTIVDANGCTVAMSTAAAIDISADCAPVELSSFTATAQDVVIALDWAIASELNFNGYELQRGLDGVNFEKLAWVQGSENSLEAKEYRYLDTNVKGGIVYYYRLKMIDLDGSYEYSAVRSAQIGGKAGDVTAFPNPTSTTLSLAINVSKDDRVNIRFYDATGKVALERVQNINEGNNLLEYNLSDLPSGLYRIVVDGQQIRATQNVVVMD